MPNENPPPLPGDIVLLESLHGAQYRVRVEKIIPPGEFTEGGISGPYRYRGKSGWSVVLDEGYFPGAENVRKLEGETEL